MDAQEEAQQKNPYIVNNHFAHRLEIIGDIGLALGDKSLTDKAVSMFKAHIDKNMYADGSTFDFHQRDALHYQQEDLMPLLRFAEAAQRNGYGNLFDYQNKLGGSLRKSVDFEIPYITGEKTHIEFRNSTVAHDRDRAAHGDPEYSPHLFDPRHAKELLLIAQLLDGRYAAYLRYTS